MSEAIIAAEGLGKRYRIGLREEAAQTFREALMGAMRAPLPRPIPAAAYGQPADRPFADCTEASARPSDNPSMSGARQGDRR